MKKLLIAAICAMAILLAACGEGKVVETAPIYPSAAENDIYINHVAGRSFKATEGQTLTFYSDGTAAYDYKGAGNHHYDYDAVILESDDAKIVIQLSKVDLGGANKSYHTEDSVSDTDIATYHITDNYVEMYGLKYKAKKTPVTTPTCAAKDCEKNIAPSGYTQYCVNHASACEGCGEFVNPGVKYCGACPRTSGGSKGSDKKEKCIICNGTGRVRYYYGESDLEAILSGHDPYTLGKCTNCDGTGYDN